MEFDLLKPSWLYLLKHFAADRLADKYFKISFRERRCYIPFLPFHKTRITC